MNRTAEQAPVSLLIKRTKAAIEEYKEMLNNGLITKEVYEHGVEGCERQLRMLKTYERRN